MSIPVFLTPCTSYDQQVLDPIVSQILTSMLPPSIHGKKVVVKPNFVAARNPLACSHPEIILAVCRILKDHGAKCIVADSPAFGSARSVARKIGLLPGLHQMNIPIATLNQPVPKQLASGRKVSIAALLLESDLIINLPKFKAHSQMRVTASVKNLFGTVPGMRKALLHCTLGDKGHLFAEMIMDLHDLFPRQLSFVDAIQAMHIKGPIHGSSYPLGLVGGSVSAVGLDTALYTILDLKPEQVPLWKEALKRKVPGSRMSDLSFPLLQPETLKTSSFLVPETLDPESFRPPQLIRGGCKRAVLYLTEYLHKFRKR